MGCSPHGYIRLHKTPCQQTRATGSPCWLDKVTGHVGEAHVSRSCRKPLVVMGGPMGNPEPVGGIQLTASQSQGPQSHHGKKVNSSNK